jgi:hypothetical protein
MLEHHFVDFGTFQKNLKSEYFYFSCSAGRKQSACFQSSRLHFSFHLPVVVFSSHFQSATNRYIQHPAATEIKCYLFLVGITAPLWLRITTFTLKYNIAHL